MHKITAYDVAKYFIYRGNSSEDDSVSNLKLQKLIYYAQGYHLALFDKPFFDESIEAWRHGPVCPEIYHEYKAYGAAPIDENISVDFSEIFSSEQIELLEEVYSVFGQFAAWKLRDMTHEESPWKNHADFNEEIPQEEMKEYFKTRLN
jgi:uncharacterized phage-associated protein